MARYIDADKIVYYIRNVSKVGLDHDVRKVAFLDEIGRIQTADVAPKSEVAREIFEEIEKAISNLEYRANTPRKTVRVEELKAQVDWVLHEVVPKTIAELKNKYTGEQT